MVDVDPVVLVGKVALQLMPSLSLIVMGMLMTAVVMVMILATMTTMTTTTMGHLAVDSKLVVDPLKPSGNSILNQTRQSKQCKTLVLNVVPKRIPWAPEMSHVPPGPQGYPHNTLGVPFALKADHMKTSLFRGSLVV